MEFYDVVGSFGPWQLKVFLVVFYLFIVGTWQNFSITFLAPNMDFHCVQPARNNRSLFNFTFDDRCVIPQDENLSTFLPCTQWEYDTSDTSETIVSEWDLVCSQDWLISFSKSIYMIGYLFSVIIFGQISDCIGRYPTIVICYTITTVSMFLSLLSVSIHMFLVLRFFQAFGRSAATTIGYTLVLEIVGPKHKTEVGILLQLSWAVGFMTLAGVAWFVRHWFWLQLFFSVSFLPVVFTFGFVPESPRWLLSRGKIKKVKILLTKASAVNSRKINEDAYLEMLKNKAENKGKRPPTIFEVFKMPKMRNRTFNLIYLWIVTIFSYYAVSYNTNDLVGNPYINVFIVGALDVPSFALALWGLRRWGRRPTLASLMMVGGFACVAILAVPRDISWLGTGLAMVGKCCSSGCLATLRLFTTELFPTGVRSATSGACSMFARIGSILAPFSRDLGKATHPAVPNVLFFLLALTGGLLALMLPETRGLDMPDTLQEGEDLGQSPRKFKESDIVKTEVIPLAEA